MGKVIYKIFLSLGCALVIANVSYTGIAYDLSDAIGFSLKNNNKIKAEKKKLESVIMDLPSALSEFFPRVQLAVNNSRTRNNNINTASLPGATSRVALSAKLQQDIFSGGSTLMKVAAANSKIKAAYHEYLYNLNDILLKVIESYQSVLSRREEVIIQRGSVDMLKKLVYKTEVGVKSGAYTKTNLYRAKGRLANAVSKLHLYQARANSAEESFNYYVGERPPKNLKVIDISGEKKFNLDEFLKLVGLKNPRIIAVDSAVSQAKSEVNVSYTGFVPTVSLELSSTKDHSFRNSAVSDASRYKVNQKEASIVVNFPIFNKNIDLINVKKSKKNYQYAKYNSLDIRHAMAAEAASAWENYNSSYSVYKESLMSENNYYQTYLSSQIEFNSGAKNIVDLIVVQEDYNNIAIERSQREYDYKVSLFKLKFYLGELKDTKIKKL